MQNTQTAAANAVFEYGPYMRLLQRAFVLLKTYYDDLETSEYESMSIYALKFLDTIKALELKHRYAPSWRARAGIEIAPSGFPIFTDIVQLSVDLSSKCERLPKLLPAGDVKQQMLDILLAGEVQDARADERFSMLQYQFADRAYLEMLNLRNLYFRFTPGKVYEADEAHQPSKDGRKAYYLSWACYDSATNLPYMYLMLFEHEPTNGTELQEGGPELVQLFETIESLGNRAPEQLHAIGVRLDEALPSIYPRAIKRNRIGPIFSPLLEQDGRPPESLAARIGALCTHAGLGNDDFVLFFETEMVLSEREEVPAGRFPFGKRKARQIFHVPKTDRELMRRGSTALHRYALMPHRLRQHLTHVECEQLPELTGKIDYLTYIEKQGRVERVG